MSEQPIETTSATGQEDAKNFNGLATALSHASITSRVLGFVGYNELPKNVQANQAVQSSLKENLTTLDFSRVRPHSLRDPSTLAAFKAHPHVENVSLLFCSKITDNTLLYASQFLPNLKSIVLEGARNITDQGVLHLANCANLEHIVLNGCFKVSHHGVSRLFKKCKKITALHLDAITLNDALLLSMGEYKLHTLSVVGCGGITDGGIMGLTSRLQGSLQVLNVAYCSKVSDASVAHLARLCPNLSSLNLYGCNRVTDTGIAALGSLTRLRKLEICVCTAVTDNGIIALLTDNGRREASPLHHLNLYGLIKLTDKALTAVGEHARQLLFFGGYGLDLITLEGAVAVLESCPALQRVDISSCPKIEEEAYRKIASSYINIKF